MTLGVVLGIAVLDWMARNAPPSPVRNAIVLGNIVGFASIAVLDVWSTFGAGRPMTKLFVLVHVFFAVAFIWAGRTWWWRAPRPH